MHMVAEYVKPANLKPETSKSSQKAHISTYSISEVILSFFFDLCLTLVTGLTVDLLLSVLLGLLRLLLLLDLLVLLDSLPVLSLTPLLFGPEVNHPFQLVFSLSTGSGRRTVHQTENLWTRIAVMTDIRKRDEDTS